jgi:dTDP-4-amino-4,6-dideoxygalactose transaminase
VELKKNETALDKILDSDTIVIATHQYGNPCAIKEIQSLCARVGAVLIEDCAGSLGTTVDGVLTGLYGDYAFFSFDSTKLLTIPSKGGCILAKNPDTLGEIEKCQSCIAPPFSHKVKHWSRGLSIYLHTAPNEMRSDTNAITLYPVFFKARATEID